MGKPLWVPWCLVDVHPVKKRYENGIAPSSKDQPFCGSFYQGKKQVYIAYIYISYIYIYVLLYIL
jgi:hypothetical protein